MHRRHPSPPHRLWTATPGVGLERAVHSPAVLRAAYAPSVSRTTKKAAVQCPERGSAEVISILYGCPAPSPITEADAGQIELGGCTVLGDDPAWRCRACSKTVGEIGGSG
jgi:hypothetical protein